MVLADSEFPIKLSESWARALKKVRQSCPGPKELKNIDFKGCQIINFSGPQIINVPGTNTCLGLALIPTGSLLQNMGISSLLVAYEGTDRLSASLVHSLITATNTKD